MGAETTRSGCITAEERTFIEWYMKLTPEEKRGVSERLRAEIGQLPAGDPQEGIDPELYSCFVFAEAEAIQTFSSLIINRWQNTDMEQEEQRDLLSALYGLDMLIAEHTRHTEHLADNPPRSL